MAFSGGFVRLEPDTATGGAVVTVRVDRGPTNALSRVVREEIRLAARAVSADPQVRAVVLSGGPKIFAAGGDIAEFAAMSEADMAAEVDALQSSFTAVARIAKPVVAAVSGYALGGGLELALCADVRVAGDNARLGQPEILLGLMPGGGGSQRLPRLVGPARAKDLIFTGRHVLADEALAIGLVDRVVPADDVCTAALDLARRFAAGPTRAIAAAKRAIDDGADCGVPGGLALERELFVRLFGTEDARSGMRSFLDSGPGNATFAGR
ncbi:MAG TPA: enoyl-CoA hydratase-related protein [Mycobacteriales bacterium]|nr:enoyl-CoA hydratase-related protein [Mycobacteriales bacterium]